MENKNLRIMLEVSLLVGAALLLSWLKLFRMPYGGSVTLEMLPLLILAFRRGGKVGILGGALHGLLKLLLSPYIVHPIQLFLDYPVPYAVLGVAGLGVFRGKRLLGAGAGIFLRYLTHVTAGVVFWADAAPEGTPALTYSLAYNAAYLWVEAALCLVLLHLLSRRSEIFQPREV